MNRLLTFVCLVALSAMAKAQPYIDWQTVYGETALDEQAEAIVELPDGGYVVAGYSGGLFDYDYMILRLNADHEVVWQQLLGGSSVDEAFDLALAPGGGFIVTGYSQSLDGDVGQNNGGIDTWVVKLNDAGEIEWSRVLGGSGEDFFRSVIALPDGNFLVAGYSDSADGDFTENLGYKDLWLVKLSAAGDVLWKRSYGGTGNDNASDIVLDAEKQQLVVIGSTSSTDGNISFNHGGKDMWLLKFDTNGNLLWEKTYGGTFGDSGKSVALGANGEAALIGDSISEDGDVTENFGQDDIWIVRVDSTGALLWQRTIGAPASDNSRDVLIDPATGHVYAVGITYDHTVSPPNYIWDVNLIKLNGTTGSIIWTQRFGGSQYDFGNSLLQNSNGKLVVAGYTDSTDGDLSGGGYRQPALHGAHNVWIFATAEVIIGLDTPENNPIPVAGAYIPATRMLALQNPGNRPATLLVADMLGRITAQYTVAPGFTGYVTLPILPKGIYPAAIYSSNGQKTTFKIAIP
ncbi:hypothetical protein C7N43_00040 [Sphingobacteriales bacterium UPWRP_1]|nr:hypothetical protein BVG80_14970 [Sphingobacteriales bacterium TSM_CSM]PSJ79051.1 hypothetical protein C7N43_00040 [Sphingobacteriales bacterium UPWRP_1]